QRPRLVLRGHRMRPLTAVAPFILADVQMIPQPRLITNSQRPVACPRCGSTEVPVVGRGSGPHTASLVCATGGRFLRWHSTKTPEERQRQRREALAKYPPSESQLRYLKFLGDHGPTPATMADASDRIDILLGKEPRA